MTQMVDAPFGSPQPPQPSPTPPPLRRESRRPGWPGVLAVGGVAALLSSVLTAGLINASDDGAAAALPATTTSSTSTAQTPPVVTGASATPNWVSVGSAVGPS